MAALTVDQILSGTDLGLTSGIDDLFVLEIGGRRVLFALNRAENSLIELDISLNGSLSVASTLLLSGTFSAGSDPLLTTVSYVGGGVSLALSGLQPTDGQEVTLTASGALGTQQNLAGVSILEAPVSLDIGGIPVLLSGAAGGGLSHFADGGSGFAATLTINDTADRYLADVAASATFVSNAQTYVVTISDTENGLNTVLVDGSGLTQVGVLGNSEGLPVSSPSDVAAISRLGEALVFVSSFGTSSISVALVPDGVPRLADHVLDSENTQFQGASSLSAISHGDFVYLAVGGSEGGVSLLTALPGGRLVHLDSVRA